MNRQLAMVVSLISFPSERNGERHKREREREREREQERDIKLILRKAVIEKCVLGPLIMRLGKRDRGETKG